ncbi:MAG: hypothetical protein ACTSW1_11185 [Candidatus Hodarchaeales archaeon]
MSVDTVGNLFDNNNRGNYYSKYTGEDNNSDGIGDTPYQIALDVTDNYPLMQPVDLKKPIIVDHDTSLTFTTEDSVSISWNANDDNPSSYKIFESGSVVTTEAWMNGSNVVNLGPLSQGYHIFTILLFDIDRNSASFTVHVTVNELISTSSSSSGNIPSSNQMDPLGGISGLIFENIVPIAVFSGVGVVSILLIRKIFGKKPKRKRRRNR